MKKLLTLLALPLLASCGGETYEVPLTTAYQTLTSVGTPGALRAPLEMMSVASVFQAVPDDDRVEWRFTQGGKDVGKVIAKGFAKGDGATDVKIWYVEGTAADEGLVEKARPMVRDKLKRLLVEAVDSKFEKRTPDAGMAQQVQVEVAQAYVGEMMREASAQMDQAVAEFEKNERESSSSSYRSPSDATKPSVNLPSN